MLSYAARTSTHVPLPAAPANYRQASKRPDFPFVGSSDHEEGVGDARGNGDMGDCGPPRTRG